MQMSGSQRDSEIHFINEKQCSNRNRSYRPNSGVAVSEYSLKRVQFDLTIQETVEGDFDETGSF